MEEGGTVVGSDMGGGVWSDQTEELCSLENSKGGV